MNQTHEVAVSVCIVTRNRREELAAAIESALAQQDVSAEVRVYDNASNDGTVDMLTERFPEVVARFLDTNTGACHARNLALSESCAPYVFFMDDDSYFTHPQTLAEAVRFMESRRTTAAAGLPYVEPSQRGMKVWSPPLEYERNGSCAIRSVVTCACIVQRKAALEIGGFRDFFRQWGEERDFCLRLWARCYEVTFFRAPQLVHRGSLKREMDTMQYFGIRNTLLFDMLNVPWPEVAVRLLADSLRLTFHKFFTRGGVKRFGWAARALRELLSYRHLREPVSREIYRKYLRLPSHGPVAALAELPEPLIRDRAARA